MAKDKYTGRIYYLPKSASAQQRNLMEEGIRHGFIQKLEFNTPAQIALAWAKRGDWECLADYIETSRMGTSEIRAFLVAVLRGGVKEARKSSPTVQKSCKAYRTSEIFSCVAGTGNSSGARHRYGFRKI
jgi:hypothetical protein